VSNRSNGVFLALCVCALVVGCGLPKYRVIATSDPDFVDVPEASFDQVKTSWASRGGLAITTITRISPSDWVRKESIRVLKTSDAITVCYSVTHRPRMTRNLPAVPTRLIFVIAGVPRDEPRPVRVSRSC
jgi:hypothetical protein